MKHLTDVFSELKNQREKEKVEVMTRLLKEAARIMDGHGMRLELHEWFDEYRKLGL